MFSLRVPAVVVHIMKVLRQGHHKALDSRIRAEVDSNTSEVRVLYMAGRALIFGHVAFHGSRRGQHVPAIFGLFLAITKFIDHSSLIPDFFTGRCVEMNHPCAQMKARPDTLSLDGRPTRIALADPTAHR